MPVRVFLRVLPKAFVQFAQAMHEDIVHARSFFFAQALCFPDLEA